MQVARRLRRLLRRFLVELRLEYLRARLQAAKPGAVVKLGGVALHITDGLNAYMQYKDEVVRRIYDFEPDRGDPVVIDGGANMGAFTIATRLRHARARIVAFEPDPAIAAILRENLARNGIESVRVVEAALGGVPGTATFASDGESGGALATAGSTTVRVEVLSAWLGEEVDFVKLNIEGAELDVLREAAAAGRLRNIKALVIEYHGWPRAPQRLHDVLAVLDANGFRYVVHDFDEQTNPVTKPPFRDPGDAPWFALVAAWRVARPATQP